MQIAISTVAFRGQSMGEIIEIAKKEHWMIEFSSGMPYSSNLMDQYLNADIPRMLHNYFPPPEKPFVLNLASKDESIHKKSIQHCKQGLFLAKKTNGPYYSAHAGFCGDPKPEELGHTIKFDPNFDRELYWQNFIQAIGEILDYANELDVDFLIENNVCAKFNVVGANRNPLLCADPEEIKKLFTDIKHPRLGLLLDTGHLQVSANTLEFDKYEAVQEMTSLIKGIHHSENNGVVDNNEKLDYDYWFLKFMNAFSDLIHVLEVKDLERHTILDQINILNLSPGR
jgi:sugar phosphate isomerase/epimerase